MSSKTRLRMSLRLRLTLVTTVLVVLATAALGVAIYVTAERLLISEVDESLYAEISEARVRSLIESPRLPQEGVYVDTALGRVNRDGVSVLPLRDAGTVDSPIPLPALTPDQIAAAAQAPITTRDTIDFRVAVRSHGPGLATVVAASPLTEVQDNLARLMRAIIWFGIAVAALGAIASWIVIWHAFRPMQAMVAEASVIARGSTDRRLPESARGTEIGTLTTAINHMIDALAEAIARAERSEDRLRTFVSDASHEIRTPLTVIRGYSELLATRSSAMDDQEVRGLDRISTESRRLDRLVTRLLTLERSTAPSRTPFEEVQLDVLVAEAGEDIRVLDPGRTVEVSLAPATVHADRDALRQLLSNAVQNVLRHTPPGSPVALSLRIDGGQALATIDDAGPGMDPAVGESLARGTTSDADGFGLGLSIMAAIVDQQAGTLRYAKSPLGGLRVEISLPLMTAGGDPR